MANIKHGMTFSMSASGMDKIQTSFDKIGRSLKMNAIATAAWTKAFDVIGKSASFVFNKMKDSVVTAVKQFADFEQAALLVGQVSGLSMEQVREHIDTIPKSLGNATDLTMAWYDILQSGISDPVKALEMLEKAAIVATDPMVDLDTVITALIPVMTNYGGSLRDVEEATDFLIKTNVVALGGMENVVKGVQDGVLMGKQLGLTLDEVGVSYAVITRATGNAAEAGTFLKNVFKQMQMKITDTKSALLEAGKAIGIFDRATLIASIQSKGFGNTLLALVNAGKAAGKGVSELFTELRGQQGVLALTVNGLEEYNKTLKEHGEVTLDTAQKLKDFEKTLKGIYATYKNTLFMIGIEIIKEWAPNMKKALKDVTEGIKANKAAIVAGGIELGESLKYTYDEMAAYLKNSGITFKSAADGFIKTTKSVTDIIIGLSGNMAPADKDISGWYTAGKAVNNVGQELIFLKNTAETAVAMVALPFAAITDGILAITTGDTSITAMTVTYNSMVKDMQEGGEAIEKIFLVDIPNAAEKGTQSVIKSFNHMKTDYIAVADEMQTITTFLDSVGDIQILIDTAKINQQLDDILADIKLTVESIESLNPEIRLNNVIAKAKIKEISDDVDTLKGVITEGAKMGLDLDGYKAALSSANDMYNALSGAFSNDTMVMNVDSTAALDKIGAVRDQLLDVVLSRTMIPFDDSEVELAKFSIDELRIAIDTLKDAKIELDASGSVAEIKAVTAEIQLFEFALNKQYKIMVDGTGAIKTAKELTKEMKAAAKWAMKKKKFELDVKEAEIKLEKLRKDIETPGWDKALRKELHINIKQPESAVGKIANLLKTIPSVIKSIIKLDNMPFMSSSKKALKSMLKIIDHTEQKMKLELDTDRYEFNIQRARGKKSGLASITGKDLIKELVMAIDVALSKISNVVTSLKKIKDHLEYEIVIDKTMAVKQIDDLVNVDLKKIPNPYIIKTALSLTGLKAGIKAALVLLDDYVRKAESKRPKMVMRFKTKGSPEHDFTEGIKYYTKLLNDMPNGQDYTFQMSKYSANRGAVDASNATYPQDLGMKTPHLERDVSLNNVGIFKDIGNGIYQLTDQYKQYLDRMEAADTASKVWGIDSPRQTVRDPYAETSGAGSRYPRNNVNQRLGVPGTGVNMRKGAIVVNITGADVSNSKVIATEVEKQIVSSIKNGTSEIPKTIDRYSYGQYGRGY